MPRVPFTLVVVDFETASPCDLKACGAHVYAEHWGTEILCLAFEVIGQGTGVWTPGGCEHDDYLRRLAADEMTIFIAHNAAFEQAIWREIMAKRFGFPELPARRWHDTMAACANRVIPLKLERALPAVGLDIEKDMAGNRLTLSLSKPRKDGSYDRSPESLQRVYEYCASDAAAESALHARLGFLPRGERRVWLLDQCINHRGVRLDLPLVRQMQAIVEVAGIPLAGDFRELTGGLSFGQIAKFKDWLVCQGVAIPDLRKETIDKLLGEADEEEESLAGDEVAEPPERLPDHVLRALAIRRLAGSASIKKLARMQSCTASDGRAHGLLQYHGAGTGRWAGRLLQPQNFPKGSLEFDGSAADPSLVVDALMSGDPDYVGAILGKPAIEAVISGLRHCIIAEPEHALVVGDFATIEARVVLALAGQWDKVDLLASGQDVYCDMASKIFRRPITKADKVERQMGKAAVLGLGFQMGWKKFRARYAQEQEPEFAQGVVETYRDEWAPRVPRVWQGLEEAALRTAQTGRRHVAYGVEYRIEEQWMAAHLPSGRDLWYHRPMLRNKAMPWDETDIRPTWTYRATKVGKLVDVDAYGGSLTENVVQALARDLMVHAMFTAEAAGFPLVLTVHDELITEVEDYRADAETLKQIMEDRPPWAIDMRIPVAAECWAGERYRK